MAAKIKKKNELAKGEEESNYILFDRSAIECKRKKGVFDCWVLLNVK